MARINIGKELQEIKEVLKQSEKRSISRFNISIGLVAIIFSATLIPIKPNAWVAVILFIAGYVAITWPGLSRLWHRAGKL